MNVAEAPHRPTFARGALTCPRCRNPRTICYQTLHGTDAQGEALTTRRHQCLDPACAHKFRTTQRHGLRE